MSRVRLAALAVAGVLAVAPATMAQKPYIGFVYPAGGQQGTTFQVKLGGQGLDDVERAVVTGEGVTARVVEFQRKLGPQEIQLLAEQLRELKQDAKGKLAGGDMMSSNAMTNSSSSGDAMMMSSGGSSAPGILTALSRSDPTLDLMARIDRRIKEYVLRPASASLSALAYVEVKVAPNAPPGVRELSLITPRGVSNPLVFHIGQLPELCRKPMITAQFQVLGKEDLALRNRPDDEVEDRIMVPCTVNGQVASGEVNRYRFEARKGQRLIISAAARQLVPYLADAVPGWFQPVLSLYDANGKEVAYNDDYRFKPDPVIFYEVPKDGEYVFAITDAIYRGREDFVYRVTIGEVPTLTSIFPLGGRVGEPVNVGFKGWNVQGAKLIPPPAAAEPGIVSVAVRKDGFLSNPMPFQFDTLPECFDQESNNDAAHAQTLTLPVIVNGHIDRKDDWDVFQFTGRAGQTVVAEVTARRLESPLDSLLKVTDASGKLVAYSDDCEDLAAGTNTHDADSYVMFKLPADGTYYVHLGDTARSGGEAYGYRLRISEPRPDFALRMVPSSLAMRSRSSAAVSVYVIRKDGFTGPIKVALKDPPTGFSSYPVTLTGNQTVTRLVVRTDLVDTKDPVPLAVEGRGLLVDEKATAEAQKAERARRAEAWKKMMAGRKGPPPKRGPQPPLPLVGTEFVRDAVPAEDRMQAFLWRHLVPAQSFLTLVYDPTFELPPKRVRKVFPETPAEPAPTAMASASTPAPKAKFTKQQVIGRLRQIKLLFEEGLLTDEFDHKKVMECEAAQ
jgi:hypothetical protein